MTWLAPTYQHRYLRPVQPADMMPCATCATTMQGYADLGVFNDGKTITPTLNGLLTEGIMLTDYYTFKICSPSRAAMLTGRYPWAAGLYNMNQDTDHCTTNSTALPQLLKPLGYA
eukprot:SAG25_NODE_1621_length_2660_cov_0.979695_5_plen_115_part_00